jgi:DNA polymerase elongation subunit (family B)
MLCGSTNARPISNYGERAEKSNMSPTKLKVLLLDIETAPLLAFIWRPSDDYVTHDRLEHDSFMLCWSAKWHGQKPMFTGVLDTFEAIDQDDARIVEELADLIREADIIVGHNLNFFDLPMLNNRLLILGLEPVGVIRTIDTCKLAKQNFRLSYNKLDHLGEILGLGRKIKTDFDLWRSCYHGSEKALNKMLKYNIQDVLLLEGVYDKLLPYVNGTPRQADPEFDGQTACPHCGSIDIMKRGTYRTNVSSFQQWQCRSCTKYSRSRCAEKRHFSVAPL